MTAIDSASLESFERLADIGAWLVIVGVIGEGLEIALKICEHKCKNEKFLSWYNKHDFSIEIWGFIFWIIVVVGLVMELRYSGKSQLLVKKENSRITQEAGEARKTAGNAELEASKANERIAGLNKEAADARLETAQIKMQMANMAAWVKYFEPIDLGTNDISAELRSLKGINVELRYMNNDRERESAEKLSLIFAGSGWKIANENEIRDFGGNGIFIGINQDEVSARAANLLLKNLLGANVLAERIYDLSNVPDKTILVAVCAPLPPSGKPPDFAVRQLDEETEIYLDRAKEIRRKLAQMDEKRMAKTISKEDEIEYTNLTMELYMQADPMSDINNMKGGILTQENEARYHRVQQELGTMSGSQPNIPLK